MGGARLYGLDALRGVAALAVALHHFAHAYHLPPLPINPFLAVDLFFILSGFVMARTYEGRLRNGLTTVRFIGLRYRRLFMPLAIGSTIGFGLKFVLFGPSGDLLAAYILILGFLPAVWTVAFYLNSPAWSLFVEIVCNCFHGAIFSKISNVQLLVVAAAFGLLFIASFAAGLSMWDGDFASILWLTPRELTCYLVGIWMFRNYGDAPLGNKPLLAIVGFATALGIASINAGFEVAALIASPFIVRASLALPRIGLAVWAGALSYPLYATHVPVIKAARVLGLDQPLCLALVGTIALLVTWAFEMRRPSRRPAVAF